MRTVRHKNSTVYILDILHYLEGYKQTVNNSHFWMVGIAVRAVVGVTRVEDGAKCEKPI